MPVKLGLTAAGGVANALGGSGKAGPTSQSQNVSTNTSSNTSLGSSSQTPNLNPLMGGFQSSLVPALSQMYSQASQPVYGATQVAQVANNGDAATNAASNALSANLARRGALTSGAQAAGQTQLQQANTANTVGFENQLPLLNYQNEMQQQGNVLGLAEGLTGKALTSNTTLGSNTGSTVSDGTNTTTAAGPAFGAGMLNTAGGLLGNAGMNGGGKGGGKTSPASSIAGGLDPLNPLGGLV